MERPEGAFSREFAINYIRQAAMHGLIYTSTKENIELIENLYEKELAAFQNSGKKTKMFSSLVEALVSRDFIEEYGFETYMKMTTGGISEYLSIIEPYISRYIDLKELNSKKTDETQN